MALSLKSASKIITDWLGGFVPWAEYRSSNPAPANGELVPLTCDDTGALRVAASVTASVDTTGLATDTLQGTGNTSLAAIDTKLGARLPAALGGGGGVKIDGSGTALPVSAASLPLPTGAATSALQGGGLPAALGAGGGLKVDGSGTALPVADGGGSLTVDGTVTAVGGAANQAAPSGNPVPIAGYDSGNSGRVQVPDVDSNGGLRLQSGGTSGAAAPSRVTQVGGSNGTNLYAFKVSAAGILHTVPGVGASYTSTAAEASCVVQASACAPARVSMTNGNAAARFCLMFDSTSLPSNGAIPKDGGGSQSTNSRNFLVFPVPTARFATGLVVASSSTASSLTIGSSDALFSVDLFPATA